MNVRALRKVILTALASSTLGGPSACDECTPSTFHYVGDLLVSPRGAGSGMEAELTPIVEGMAEGGSRSADASDIPDDAAAFLRDAGTPNDYLQSSVPFAVEDAGTYDVWLAALSREPCTEICEDLIPRAQIDDGVITVTGCVPPARVGEQLAVHCTWTDVVCFANPSGAGSGAGDGCSLGRGRVPAAFVPRTVSGSALARFFATAAELEDASVASFAIVARDLEKHHAPKRLVRAALRAGGDEVRHARVMSSLARRHGAAVPPAGGRPPRWRPRPLETVAMENMVEGCVRETYGAVDATWMARHARDRGVRAAMVVIARDETRHAALSWQIADWSSRLLGESARASLAEARRAAILQLSAELHEPQSRTLVQAGLVPPARERVALLSRLGRGLQRAGRPW